MNGHNLALQRATLINYDTISKGIISLTMRPLLFINITLFVGLGQEQGSCDFFGVASTGGSVMLAAGAASSCPFGFLAIVLPPCPDMV